MLWPLFWGQMMGLMQKFPTDWHHDPVIDVRLYIGAQHAVWFAAWNSLHEALWLGESPRSVDHVSGTCNPW